MVYNQEGLIFAENKSATLASGYNCNYTTIIGRTIFSSNVIMNDEGDYYSE